MLMTVAVGTVQGAHSVATLLSVLLKVLVLVAILFGVFVALVVAWPIIQQVLIVAPLIAAFAWVTYPRSKAVKG